MTFLTVKYSMYGGSIRNPIITTATATMAVKRNPVIVRPRLPLSIAHILSHHRMLLPMRLNARLLMSSQLNQMKNALPRM